MNTKPIQIPVRDSLMVRLNKMCDRLADLMKVLPNGDFTTVKRYLRGAEVILEHFNPQSGDTKDVIFNLDKAEKAFVDDFFKCVQVATEKKEKSELEVKVTTTGRFVSETQATVNVPAVLANKNMLPLSALRDLKVAAVMPNRSRKGEEKKGNKKEPKKEGSKSPKRVSKAEVTTKKRATK